MYQHSIDSSSLLRYFWGWLASAKASQGIEVVQLASRDSSRLRIVCPFAKEYLARHPELKERYAVAAQASIADNESLSGGQTMAGA